MLKRDQGRALMKSHVLKFIDNVLQRVFLRKEIPRELQGYITGTELFVDGGMAQ